MLIVDITTLCELCFGKAKETFCLRPSCLAHKKKDKVSVKYRTSMKDEEDVRAFLQLNFDIEVHLLRSTRPCGVVIPLLAVNPDLRVIIVCRGHDGFHILGCIDDTDGIGIHVIRRP